MRHTGAAAVLCLWAGTAGAACDTGEELFFGCTFSNGAKAVQVCVGETQARYRFGPVGGVPELELDTSLADLDYTPWPGIGRTIWEQVVFENKGFRYAVTGIIEREFGEDEDDEIIPVFLGGILVTKDEQELADLTCDPGSVDFSWSQTLFDAKTRLGLCLDREAEQWVPCE